jgi:MoCo/4Fe-4S cofactor protein with predicted Tat translocation signal
MRPQEFITTMGYQPAGDQEEIGRRLITEGIQHTRCAVVDELFHLPPMSDSPKTLDLAGARARLEGKRGREYWRNLEELAGTPEFEDLLQREFPRQAIGWSDDENGEGAAISSS